MFLLFLLLLDTVVLSGDYPFVSYNGMYNNPSQLSWGSTGSPISQPLRAYYYDGAGSTNFPGRSTPRAISLALFSDPQPVPLSTNYTAMLPYFMEFMNHDILDLRDACPPDNFAITITSSDPQYGNKTDNSMPCERKAYTKTSGTWSDMPRQQVNFASSWVDGGHVYGVSKGWSDLLRSGVSGRLVTNSSGYAALNSWGVPLAMKLQPTTFTYPNNKKLFLYGDTRSNKNPVITALHWLFVKEHNRIAAELKAAHGMNDKWLFDKSRYLTIARLQKILMYDAVGSLVGKDNIPPYAGYQPHLSPDVNFLYAGAAKYLLYTLVPDMMYVANVGTCELEATDTRLCNYYWDGQSLVERYGPEAILTGQAFQPAGEVDMNIAQDIRSKFYGPMHWSRRDGIALAIQRGRDLGVPPLNTVLLYYRKQAMAWEDWEAVVSDQVVESLKILYSGDANQIELFVGGMLLSTGGQISEIFRLIILDQFLTLRNSDRFWYENPYSGMGCTGEEMKEISQTTLKSILSQNNVDMSHLTNDDIFLLDGLPAECVLDSSLFNLTECIGEEKLDYNYNTTPYAVPLLAPIFLIFAVVLVVLARRMVYSKSQPRKKDLEENKSEYGVITELQASEGDREVEFILDYQAQILATKSKRKLVRSISLKILEVLPIVKCSNNDYLLLLSIPKEHDILLKFTSKSLREKFCEDLINLAEACKVEIEHREVRMKQMLRSAKTESHRQQLVDSFLASIFSELMKKDVPIPTEMDTTDDKDFRMKGIGSDVLQCELTRAEFASALGLKPEQQFVEKVFPLVDKNKNGLISFREFLSFMVLYSNGSSTDKLQLMFNMYDLDKNGSLHVNEIKVMIRSMLEMVAASIKPEEIDTLISALLNKAGCGDKIELSFLEFKKIMSGYEHDLEKAQLEVQGVSGAKHTNKKLFTVKSPHARGREIKRYIENNRLELFYCIVFLLIIAVLFAERFITYSKYKFHTGYPQLLGYSLPITRGSAAVLMFCFPLFILVMCKNTITHLRGTFLKRYIPLDSNRHAHIMLGSVTLIFILLHCVGHGYNFYMFSSLSPDHLNCMLPKTWLDGKPVATVVGLLFGTITGVTGILLVLALLTMYILATEYSRRYLYSWFWNAHQLYPFVLALIVLHGSARLLQEPTFHYYLIGPAILFIIDKLISISRKKREIPLMEANILPSEVTNLVFKRPVDFHYLAGQYVKIALVNSGTGRDEYHPFTLTSAPHENFLSVHIRTCKGWTKILRNLVIKNAKNPERNPNLYVDGPFGEAHQDYMNYEVVILVGGGIGVTPFASILKDLVHKSKSVESSMQKAKKVYFLWSTRTQKQFEWLLDIIGKCEQEDTRDLLDTHIFITRFYQKSDLRTTMLYICERQFQGVSNRSLFTGLKAVTHFGRPDFDRIFEDIRSCHEDVRKFGVFVCGPPAMSDSVTLSCSKITGKQTFSAYAENF